MLLILLTSSVWVTIAPVIVINVIALVSIFFFTFSKKRPEKPDYLKGRHESRFLNSFFREWWYWITNPIAELLIKMKISPNSITVIGLVVSFISAIFFAVGLLGYAGWIMVFGATFDMFDGRVARLLNKSSRSGAYLDSVIDRFGEGAIFLGIAYYYRSSWVMIFAIIALIGSTLVSYTRARGEGVGVVCTKGSMQRPERVVYIGVAAIFSPIIYSILNPIWPGSPAVLLIAAICFIAVMTNFTAIIRIIYIMNELDSQDRDEEKLSLPQILTKLSTKEGRSQAILKAKYGYDRSQSEKKLVVMLMVDGANYNLFKELLEKGDLPNISRHVLEDGSFLKATSTFPSTTGPAFTPFITGCFAGTADIPGIRWFDRRVPPEKKLTFKRFRDYYGWGSYALDSDLSKSVKTIFEYSKRAVNILGMLNRGAGVIRDPAFFKVPFLFYHGAIKDDMEAVERSTFRLFTNALKKSPDFVFYYFPTIDKCAHKYHGRHETVISAYSRLDSYVGKMVQLLKDQGIYETTSIIITSDHGHSDVSNHFDLDNFLEKKMPTLYAPSKFNKWQSAEAINMVSGNSMSNIYLRNGDWRDYNFIEDIEKTGLLTEMLNLDAIDLIAGRSGDGGVVVASKKGWAHIQEGGDGKINYRTEGGDPFGYTEIPNILTEAEALSKTWNSEYPDGILQAAQIFRSGRAGDLVVSASNGFDLRARFEEPEHKSTHGSLHADHMFVPLCMNSKIKIEMARTADVFPTVLDQLGIEADRKFDGKTLINI